ncbi:hypothetical protein CC85DRAFT_286322 [Cutaneotrichosporon oleaginosum]|uniref:F-box domain-containing protein n=1 Tax=Cutaneotrichosporon oleaginosum TaxID=879819 RepID=A0A0J1B1P7_9TREE|nr:uncharacterized protein CC85DRAFT_286322 [Cutaneotrichosporon oleaginosum]KLT41544.1 hypothetical protein CC85DRAFT_286322 [Cutaneotrichosporon oleaginosum]TXT09312.1 hypothetical protein COLE_03246 [Cutaneotrichosporon oleaginosum]
MFHCPSSRQVATPDPPPRAAPFRLGDLAYELQEMILDAVADLPVPALCAAARVCSAWHARFIPPLYSSVSLSKADRDCVLHGLGLDYLTPAALEARAAEAGGVAAYAAAGTNRKASALAHVKTLSVADSSAAASLAEALLMHGALFPSVEEMHLGPQLFRYLVNSVASFGRPRSGSAFVGEVMVSRLRPRRVRVDFPPSRGAGSFDPVLLARVTAVLVTEWKPDSIDYHNIGYNLPLALGPLTRIHNSAPCSPDDVWEAEEAAGGGCRAHALTRMHLRRTYGEGARADVLEAIAEAADPTDDGDIDPDTVPDPAAARVEYYGVPCIAAADRDAFLDKTFAHWPVDVGVDVAAHVKFFP